MALTVKDILQIPTLRTMRVVAGEKGLSRPVLTLGTTEHEFAAFADEAEKDVFKPDMFILTSLLFAKDDPSLILTAIKKLYHIGIAAFACKTVVFPTLPQEVIDFANTHDLPILQYGRDLYLEHIVFDVLDALRKENENFFSEENIDKMIADQMGKEQVYALSKNISLPFKPYAMAVYIYSEHQAFQSELERYVRKFYLYYELVGKGVVFPYQNGLFSILTARQKDIRSFRLILSELISFLSIDQAGLYVSCSLIHEPFQNLDQCIRESYYTHIASILEGRPFGCYQKIGSWQLLLPLGFSQAAKAFVQTHMEPILTEKGYYETLLQWVACQGDPYLTANRLHCHHNTVRYRLNRIKTLLGYEDDSESDFYGTISLIIRLYLLQNTGLATPFPGSKRTGRQTMTPHCAEIL